MKRTLRAPSLDSEVLRTRQPEAEQIRSIASPNQPGFVLQNDSALRIFLRSLWKLTFLPAFLLPPLLRMDKPMEARLPPLDSESVLLNLLKWSWKATEGPDNVGRRSWAPVCEKFNLETTSKSEKREKRSLC